MAFPLKWESREGYVLSKVSVPAVCEGGTVPSFTNLCELSYGQVTLARRRLHRLWAS